MLGLEYVVTLMAYLEPRLSGSGRLSCGSSSGHGRIFVDSKGTKMTIPETGCRRGKDVLLAQIAVSE